MYVYDQVLHSTFVSKNYQVQFDMMDCEKYKFVHCKTTTAYNQ